ncbi:hypothetical protein ACIG87_10450 [Micromonospora sp. NPDC051925]|uniref:hypothetical protein n=1 Tax=Micromonospora sp. NPDC051925 TaxID=3364288 RepID=UPI0037C5F7ED
MPEQGEQILAELAVELAGDVVRRYRIDEARAVEVILDEWRRNPKLLAVVASAGSAKEAQRTRVYKDAATLTKKTIYNRLRAYRSEPAAFDTALRNLVELPGDASAQQVEEAATAIAAAHVSTAERLGHRAEFLRVLEAANPPGSRVVVDAGAGVLPTLLGADWLHGQGITQYWAPDKDARAVAAVEAYAARLPAGLVRPAQWNVADGWEALHRLGLPATCDVAWLLKVVPVVLRQEPQLAPVLAAAPAARILISGSRVAMAKRQNIEARERRVVQRFCADHGLRVVDEHVTDDEFFLLAERG